MNDQLIKILNNITIIYDRKQSIKQLLNIKTKINISEYKLEKISGNYVPFEQIQKELLSQLHEIKQIYKDNVDKDFGKTATKMIKEKYMNKYHVIYKFKKEGFHDIDIDYMLPINIYYDPSTTMEPGFNFLYLAYKSQVCNLIPVNTIDISPIIINDKTLHTAEKEIFD